MVPALQKSVSPFIRSRSTYVMEHLLNIAIPNHILWLLGFYAFFHSYLNVVAELLKFGDRRFYEDWCVYFTLSFAFSLGIPPPSSPSGHHGTFQFIGGVEGKCLYMAFLGPI
ncbi:unnamed protein product [Dibothriocephalus latus]|uniref:diacylglycerol O-acyltransferase n=1 Tax=Dibothriocephalus latus TaxID=60516 RepID=A0A3P7PJ42_DIBLA|nr:unnamed protein product [Dibothriocephalus latus]